MADAAAQRKGQFTAARQTRNERLAIDSRKRERDYFEKRPDVNDPNQLVSFGAGAHRGTPFHGKK